MGHPIALIALLHGGAPGGFSWTRWSIHPSVLIGDAALLAAYFIAVGPLRRRLGAGPRDPWQTTAFVAAIGIMFVALDGPIHDLSDYYLFSGHMVQHMLLMMVMPPLLLLGLPAWLLRKALLRRGVEPVARVLTHPATAFVAYNAVFVGWHFPAAYNYALEHHAVHIVEHLLFMATAVMMWWPVIDPLPELSRLGSMMRMLYIFAFGLPMSIVAAIFSFADAPLLSWYATAPRIFGLGAVEDQTLGGVIMWVPGMLIYWTAVTIIFLRYSSREEREEPRGGLGAGPSDDGPGGSRPPRPAAPIGPAAGASLTARAERPRPKELAATR